jgi:hypothetical protein
MILPSADAQHVATFNAADDESRQSDFRRATWDWIVPTPLWDCPSTLVEEIYYYR